MADACCKPDWLLKDAEQAMSPREMAGQIGVLHSLSGNPFPEGREWQESQWKRGIEQRARRLIWC